MTTIAGWRRAAALAAAAAMAAVPLAARHVAAPPGRMPVVVELFTSEGCSSCPPADAVLRELQREQPVAGAEIIPLGEHVDYWDQLGWRDRFSSPAFTSRQQTYGAALRVDSIYTPQIVVDGQTELVGSNAVAARRAIEKAAQQPHGRIVLSIDSAGVEAIAIQLAISGLPAPRGGDRDDAIVAITEDGLSSEVRRGENRGRTLAHAAVARSLSVAGSLTPSSGVATIAAPRIAIGRDWNRAHLTIVAFVQESRSGRIVAAAAQPFAPAR